MIAHFKETGHVIDTEKQVLKIFTPPNTSYYVNNQQDFYDTILPLEQDGRGWSAEVVDYDL
jgi:hypothetical protein